MRQYNDRGAKRDAYAGREELWKLIYVVNERVIRMVQSISGSIQRSESGSIQRQQS